MNWTQAKVKYPKLSPFKDADKDGVSNWLDCKPYNRNKQGILHDIKKSFTSAPGWGVREIEAETERHKQEIMEELDKDEAKKAAWKRSVGREDEIEDDARASKYVRKHFGY